MVARQIMSASTSHTKYVPPCIPSEVAVPREHLMLPSRGDNDEDDHDGVYDDHKYDDDNCTGKTAVSVPPPITCDGGVDAGVAVAAIACIGELPNDITQLVFSKLELGCHLQAAAAACKRWRLLTTAPGFWEAIVKRRWHIERVVNPRLLRDPDGPGAAWRRLCTNWERSQRPPSCVWVKRAVAFARSSTARHQRRQQRQQRRAQQQRARRQGRDDAITAGSSGGDECVSGTAAASDTTTDLDAITAASVGGACPKALVWVYLRHSADCQLPREGSRRVLELRVLIQVRERPLGAKVLWLLPLMRRPARCMWGLRHRRRWCFWIERLRCAVCAAQNCRDAPLWVHPAAIELLLQGADESSVTPVTHRGSQDDWCTRWADDVDGATGRRSIVLLPLPLPLPLPRRSLAQQRQQQQQQQRNSITTAAVEAARTGRSPPPNIAHHAAAEQQLGGGGGGGGQHHHLLDHGGLARSAARLLGQHTVEEPASCCDGPASPPSPPAAVVAAAASERWGGGGGNHDAEGESDASAVVGALCLPKRWSFAVLGSLRYPVGSAAL
jgi:hypothetical protein